MSHHHRRAAAVSAPDPYFSNTVLLLTGNGTNGGQNNTFIDSSSNNFTITRFGNTTQGSFSPFTGAGGSGYFDGTGDYLNIADNAALELGSDDFTIEGWMYHNALPTSSNGMALLSKWASGQKSWLAGIYNSGGTYQVFFSYTTNGSTQINIAGNITSLATGSWNHFAYCRSGSTFRSFFNGSEVTSSATISGTLFNGTSTVDVGRTADNFNYINGYISNCRLVKSAVYTSNFTPPTAPLTAITDTQLLLNFTNGSIVDATGKNNLETVGNAQISTSVKKYGTGSMAFDGTGDWLVLQNNPDLFAFGSGDFTIECWLYIAGSQVKGIYDSRPLSTQGIYPTLYVNNLAVAYFVNSADRIISSNLSANTWYHVALCRNVTSTKLFINGTQSGSTYTDTNVYLNPATRPTIGSLGYDPNTYSLNGYIDDLRITKGVARYTANFTPPYRQLPTR